MSEKPFAPTQQRLRKARAEGNLPKAQELATLLSFVGVTIALVLNMHRLIEAAHGFLIEAIAVVPRVLLPDRLPSNIFLPYIEIFAQITIFALGAGCVMSCGLSLWATRATLTPITVKLERVASAAQIKQLFSAATVMAFLRALGSAVVCTIVLLPFVASMIAASVGLRTAAELTAQAWNHVIDVLAVLAGVGLAVAALEVTITLRKRNEKLRMTHEEIRREAKEQQGDPHLRGMRKRRHRSLLRGGVAAARKATVIITNPTHLAIALLYAPPEVAVPRIVARAADQAAAEIRRAAQEADVPCIEHVALARRLWAECEEGETIPPDTYAVVAPIIAAVTHAVSRKRRE